MSCNTVGTAICNDFKFCLKGKMNLEAIQYTNKELRILNQLLLPFQSLYVPITSVQDAWKSINTMQVRGAPAIAIVGCLSLAVELNSIQFSEKFKCKNDLRSYIQEKLAYLLTARPTAVNISKAAHSIDQLLTTICKADEIDLFQMKDMVMNFIEGMLESDIRDNSAIGFYGAAHISDNCSKPIRILTHCNTGSLATASYGTALGVIRSLRKLCELDHVFCTETRPYNQGSRLTAYELLHDEIPGTLICDSMAGWAMKKKGISAVVVGADRVAANGDTANKIGTYQLAVLASHHSVPFYVAAPISSIDWNIADGDCITVEERPAEEMTYIQGHRIAAEGINCWNPAFDITPANLITGVITEKGVFTPEQLQSHLKPYSDQ